MTLRSIFLSYLNFVLYLTAFMQICVQVIALHKGNQYTVYNVYSCWVLNAWCISNILEILINANCCLRGRSVHRAAQYLQHGNKVDGEWEKWQQLLLDFQFVFQYVYCKSNWKVGSPMNKLGLCRFTPSMLNSFTLMHQHRNQSHGYERSQSCAQTVLLGRGKDLHGVLGNFSFFSHRVRSLSNLRVRIRLENTLNIHTYMT